MPWMSMFYRPIELSDEERKAELIRIAQANKQVFDLSPYVPKPKESMPLDYGWNITACPDGSDQKGGGES